MSIVDNQHQRARFLASIAALKNTITDLQRDIDVAFRSSPVPPVATMKALAEADTHLSLASVELDEVADRIRQL